MNEPSAPSPNLPELGEFQLGPWTVSPAEGILSSDGRTIRLEPRVMDVLAYLAAHADRVVSKEELIAAVWGGAFVEEGALSQAIHSLRKAMGDDARQPRYIQTIPKRGYRLIAPVEPITPPAAPAAPKPAAEAPPPPSLPTPPAAPPARSEKRAGLLLVALGLAILAVVWVSSARFGKTRPPVPPGPSETDGTRIVVLPFGNLGEPGAPFFADGLTEEINKDLTSLRALQVISQTSVRHYQGTGKTPAEIGKELGVDYVLDGTVQWEGGPAGRPRVRVIARLTRAADGTQAWGDSFDGQVADIFKLQAEISQDVIGRLGVALLPEEKRTLRRVPTGNLEAYQAYLRGLELRNQPYYSEKHIRQSLPMFERAVELDPGFAKAWAELSQTHSYLAFNADPSPGRVEQARRALDRALELRPDLDAALLAQAYFTYRCLGDYEAAHEQLAAAARRSPHNPEILQALGFVLRRLGRFAEAIDALERSFALDPRAVKLIWAIAETQAALRDYQPADRSFAQAIALAPDQPVYWEERALNRLAWTGDVDETREVLVQSPVSGHPELIPISFQLDLYQRDYRGALARISAKPLGDALPQVENRVALFEALARERLGDRAGARAAAEANRASLEERVSRFPNEVFYRAYLAVALAQLGRRDEALREAEEAVRLKRGDAFSGPRMMEMQAMVDAILGRRREAVERLSGLLSTPYQCPVSVADLRLHPVWDSLRGDPGFEALLSQD